MTNRGSRSLRKGRFSWSDSIYFISTFKAHQAERIDNTLCFEVMIEELNKLEEEGILDCLAFVVMPDHVHMIIRLGRGREISYAMKRFKGTTARKINELRKNRGSMWYETYHDHMIRPDEPISSFVNYILMNPVKKGLVNAP